MTKEILMAGLLVFLAGTASANNLLIYKHVDFQDWEAQAGLLNSAIASIQDSENPTEEELQAVATAKDASIENGVALGDFSPSGDVYTVTPGEVVELSVPFEGDVSTAGIYISTENGSAVFTGSDSDNLFFDWVAPYEEGEVVITVSVSPVIGGDELQSETYTVVGGKPTPPTFSISNQIPDVNESITVTSNLDSINPEPGETLSYSFEVRDKNHNTIVSSSSNPWVFSPNSLLGSSWDRYYVVNIVTDGTYTIESLPKHFLWGSGTYGCVIITS